MKAALIALSIGFVLLIFLSASLNIYGYKQTVDVHFHDTYFILSYSAVIFFILLFLGTFFSIGGLIGTTFKNKIFWILALIFLLADGYFLVCFYHSFI